MCLAQGPQRSDAGEALTHGPMVSSNNKLGRGPLGDATIPNIKALGPLVSNKKIFSCFPYISLYKT